MKGRVNFMKKTKGLRMRSVDNTIDRVCFRSQHDLLNGLTFFQPFMKDTVWQFIIDRHFMRGRQFKDTLYLSHLMDKHIIHRLVQIFREVP